MPSIHETAYPRLKATVTACDLIEVSTPTLEKVALATSSVAHLHFRRIVVWSLPVTELTQRGRDTMTVSCKGAHDPPAIVLMGVRW
jgi:hypothetical protein